MGLSRPPPRLLLATAALLLLPAAAPAPLFGPDPLAAVSLSGAAGLVLTGASGATLASIPAVTLLAGKALLIKKLLLAKGTFVIFKK